VFRQNIKTYSPATRNFSLTLYLWLMESVRYLIPFYFTFVLIQK